MTAPWERAPTGAAAELAARAAAAVPELVTPRLRLRALRLADFTGYAAILTTKRGAFVGGPMSREEAWFDFVQSVAGWQLRGHGTWAVERRDDGALLGFITLNQEYGDPEPELGFLLLAAAEGHGYAREAAEAARGFAFGTLGWRSVVSYVSPENQRSLRLSERLGARVEPGRVQGCSVWRHRSAEVPR